MHLISSQHPRTHDEACGFLDVERAEFSFFFVRAKATINEAIVNA